jgi:multiple sugar transport system substrate-binding protein
MAIGRAKLLLPLALSAALTLAMACSSSNNNNGSKNTNSATQAATRAATVAATTAAGSPISAGSPAATKAATVATTPGASGSPVASSGGNISVPQSVIDADKALASSAGGGSSIDSVTISKPVTINFWHTQTGPNADKLNALIKDFQSKNPNITVNAQYIGNYNDLFQKVQTSIAGGQTPDLAVAYENQVAEYQAAGAVIPLEDYVKSKNYGLAKDDYADILSAYRYDNIYPNIKNGLYSFPFTKSVLALYYNADALKAAGISGPPQTWDDFHKDGLAVAKNGLKGYAISIDASLFDMMVPSFGGQVMNDTQTKYTFNNDAGVQALSLLESMVKDGSAYQIAKQFDDQNDFGAGKALFTLSSSAGLSFYGQAVSQGAKFSWNVAPPPHGNGQKPVTDAYGANVTVFKSTPEKQLASWLFVKYFTSKEINPDWSTATGYLPIRTSGFTDPRVLAKIQSLPQYKAALDIQQYGVPEPSPRGSDAARTHIQDAMTAAILDPSKDVKSLFNDAANQSNAELQK